MRFSNLQFEVVVSINKDGNLDKRYTLKILDEIIDHGGDFKEVAKEVKN